MKKVTARTKFTLVTSAQWADAIKVLAGEHAGHTLSHTLRKKLMNQLRGPFAKGMTREQAIKIIDAMGWRIRD
jgi:hypothetical protein